MKLVLRLLAVGVIAATLLLWWRGGQNTGFTKTIKTTVQTDPVTQLQYPVEHKGFFPGIDFLIAAGLLDLALWSGSFFIGKHSKTQSPSP